MARAEARDQLNSMMGKQQLPLLFGLIVEGVSAQQRTIKEYATGHHAVGLPYSVFLFGIQPNYHYVFDPMAKFMWVAQVGIVYSPFGPFAYYDVDIVMVFADKLRMFFGYDNGNVGSRLVSAGLRYLLSGRKHLLALR